MKYILSIYFVSNREAFLIHQVKITEFECEKETKLLLKSGVTGRLHGDDDGEDQMTVLQQIERLIQQCDHQGQRLMRHEVLQHAAGVERRLGMAEEQNGRPELDVELAPILRKN